MPANEDKENNIVYTGNESSGINFPQTPAHLLKRSHSNVLKPPVRLDQLKRDGNSNNGNALKYIQGGKEVSPTKRLHTHVQQQGRLPLAAKDNNRSKSFMWLLPLKSTKFKHLIPVVSSLFLSFARVPIFVTSSTLDKDDLYDICEEIASRYGLRIGLGLKSSARFHTGGILCIQYALNSYKEECLADWGKCLRYGPYRFNRRRNKRTKRKPAQVLLSEVPGHNAKFETCLLYTSRCV